MKFVTIDNRDIQVENISTISLKKFGVVESNQYEVVFAMNNGQLIQAFKGTKPACNDFKVAFITAVGETIPTPSVDWVDFSPNTIQVEKGKVGTVEMLWNGSEHETSGFTYESNDLAIAEFVLGEVLGCEVGVASIAANKDGKKGTRTVRVVASKDGVMFEFLGTSLSVGGSVMIPLKSADGAMIPFKDLVLHSSNPAVATVSAGGVIDAIGEGVAIVIADYNGHRYGTSVHVTATAAAKVMSVEDEVVEEAPKKRARKKRAE